jgi:uncharacterized protein (DUF2267 family)
LAARPCGLVALRMDDLAFIDLVASEAHLSREDAERAIHATLQTLGERIDREQARRLAAQLPPAIAPWIATTTPAERFDADAFAERVARRAGLDDAIARRAASAVLDAVARAVSREAWDDTVAELPAGYGPLLPRGRWVDVADLEELLRRVAEQAGLDRAGARRALEATLETLAERIDGGEVDDLIERLPSELHPALRRGREASGGRATRMSLQAFLRRAAQRDGVADQQEAARHLRAVFGALRATLEDELLDVKAQLPEDYVRVLALVP